MLNRHDFSIEGTFHAQAENGLLGVRRVRTLPKYIYRYMYICIYNVCMYIYTYDIYISVII